MSEFPKIPASPTPQGRRETSAQDASSRLTPAAKLAQQPEVAQRDAKQPGSAGQMMPAPEQASNPVQASKPILNGRQGLNAGLEFVQTIVDEVAKLNERARLSESLKQQSTSELNRK